MTENSLQGSDAKIVAESSIHEDQTLIGDVDRIQQVLLNLVSNAGKFLPKTHGIIKLESSLVEEGDQVHLQISVIDNGPGISEEFRPKLFQPFSKHEVHKKVNPNGNGLGLNICKLICRNLGGDIKFDPSQDGTKFTFWVAAKKPKEHDFDLLLTPGREVVLQQEM